MDCKHCSGPLSKNDRGLYLLHTIVDCANSERDAARAEVETLKAQVEELREQLEHDHPRRRCANVNCKVDSFFPGRSDQQFCSISCRTSHNTRAYNRRKRLKAIEGITS